MNKEKTSLLSLLQNLTTETQEDYKIGMITYTFYKCENGSVEVDTLREGWASATITEIPTQIENEFEFLTNLSWA